MPGGNMVVIGSSGAIGNALTARLAASRPECTVHALSRKRMDFPYDNVVARGLDYLDESALEAASAIAAERGPLDLVIVATGLLHDAGVMPEKSLRDLSYEGFRRLFEVNAALPAMIAKYFIPRLRRDGRATFAALTARVGSVSDNRLGGWYAYRASKAALNMVIRNIAIETARRRREAVVVGLHPGTVDSGLSRPFQGNVPESRLFSPEYSARRMLEVLDRLTPADSGHCFAWDGGRIEP
ncbi:MAG: SDR family NAD(P)-dependent oxidoreductase [Rhodobacter sp.]|nr:SDR family NAD(P)-dependent oxidoreductase [Rhodobacter sp.]MCY4242403.1 SDR family NAD(P)-dependent oxidoreductase [Rhodobacter sp.]